MPKTRKEEGGLGDWSSTGTFLRKPTSGWLHEDGELCDQSSINYKIWYLGCIEVRQSMRTLQYNVRTQVTKEAIVRMAEISGRLSQAKKRKVPKQLNRLLGAVDTRWAGEVNLAISAENLRISNANSNREIMNHSLPSISFASGGEGNTLDFIGYVAKDPVHERACHVFECTDCSQYVLTTIGQAFELRYKMYLRSPQPQPVEVRDSVTESCAWGVSPPLHTYEEGRGTNWDSTPLPDIPEDHIPSPGAGIYSDLPEFPSSDIHPSPPTASPPLLSLVDDGRPRVYSKLPAFPTEGDSGPARPRLENPYDTMEGDRSRMELSETGVYSVPGDITTSTEEGVYNNPMMTIKQTTPATSNIPDRIELTPPLQRVNPIYGNADAPPSHDYTNDSALAELHHPSRVAPLPKPRPRPRKPTQKESAHDSPSAGSGQGQSRFRGDPNDYDDPDALEEGKGKGKLGKMLSTPDGTYDDPEDVIRAGATYNGTYDHRVGITGGGRGKGKVGGRGRGKGRGGGGGERSSRAGPSVDYDDPQEVVHPQTNGTAGGVASANHYDTPDDFMQQSRSRTPRFDDTIYAVRRDIGVHEDKGKKSNGAVGNMASLSEALSNTHAPLPQQQYFHGVINRVEAEALLEREGEFLVRESSKIPGQFVLTGMSHEGPQHLLLMDKSGKVKSRDHEFDSVPHLVQYFTTRDIPLVIGGSQVYLRQAIINAFPVAGLR